MSNTVQSYDLRSLLGTEFSVLGSFDPMSLMLDFSGQYSVVEHNVFYTRFETSRYAEALSKVPLAVLSHELAHLAHTLTTAAGIRQYLFGTDDLILRRLLAGSAIEAAPQGVLTLPLLTTRSEYFDDPKYAEKEALWLKLWVV